MLLLATAALASPFPINFTPGLSVNNIHIGTDQITGDVNSITDYGLCSGGCAFGGNFVIDSSLLFNIYGSDSSVYLSGVIVDAAGDSAGDLGLLIDVLFQDNDKWSNVEGQPATPFPSLIAFNISNFVPTGNGGGGDDSGDDDHEHEGEIGTLCPTPTPEPASCMLVLGGLAAAILRKRAKSN